MGLNRVIDLTPDQRRTVLRLIGTHLPNTEVWAYGSRVKWTSRPQSDLDLVVFSAPEQHRQVSDLREAFEESDLPFRVDVLVWDDVSESFRERIEEEHAVVMGHVIGRHVTKARFGDCAMLVRDTVHPSDVGNIPYIGLEHIAKDKLVLKGHGMASDVTSVKSRFQRGDILFGRLRPYFRKVIRAPFDGVCSTDIWVVRTTEEERVDQGFLFCCMAHQDFVDYAASASEGTRMPRAKWEHVSRYEIDLPSLTEQRAIAHVLGTLDDKIELNQRKNETLGAMARALFKSWFVDFDPVRAKMEGRDMGLPEGIAALFPDRLVESELGEIPEGWKVGTVGEVIELAYGKALRAADRRVGDIPVYGSNGQVGWHDQKLVEGPGIIVGRKGNPGCVRWSQTDFYPIDTTFYVISREHSRRLHFVFHALKAQNFASIAADSAVPGLSRNLAYTNKQLVPTKQVVSFFNNYANCVFVRRYGLDKEFRVLAVMRDHVVDQARCW